MCFQRQESAQRVGGNVKQITAVFQTGKDVMAKMTAVTIPMRKKGVAHHVIILAISRFSLPFMVTVNKFLMICLG
jgi:hypothetical protein